MLEHSWHSTCTRSHVHFIWLAQRTIKVGLYNLPPCGGHILYSGTCSKCMGVVQLDTALFRTWGAKDCVNVLAEHRSLSCWRLLTRVYVWHLPPPYPRQQNLPPVGPYISSEFSNPSCKLSIDCVEMPISKVTIKGVHTRCALYDFDCRISAPKYPLNP